MAVTMSSDEASRVSAVIAAERRWVQAHRQLDLAVIEQMMAPEYIRVEPDGGVQTRDDVIESYQSGDRHWQWAESDQYRVRLLGDCALLFGRWRAKGVNQGELFDYSARFLAVYVERGGEWLLVGDHSTPLE